MTGAPPPMPVHILRARLSALLKRPGPRPNDAREHEMHLTDVAAWCGVRPSLVSAWRTGKEPVDARRQLQISSLLTLWDDGALARVKTERGYALVRVPPPPKPPAGPPATVDLSSGVPRVNWSRS